MLKERVIAVHDPPSARLTAQQTNLARVIVREDPTYLNHTHQRHPVTGGRAVLPLDSKELLSLEVSWERGQVACIGRMNKAIGAVEGESRRNRYLDAAVELELALDRRHPPTESFREVPDYLKDGYTDLGVLAVPSRREGIRVDKARLRPQLVSSKRLAVHELSRTDVSSDLSARLRRSAQLLRDDVSFKEGVAIARTEGGTVFLSDCVEQGTMACRHMSLLMQLRLQESGVRSRLVKGVLKLYGLKARHAWNVVSDATGVALIDVSISEGEVPLVIVGSSLSDVYERAQRVNRSYRESVPSSTRCDTMRPGA